jgi:KaiC/GvpD/RAD55 family RecA-like ATPase
MPTFRSIGIHPELRTRLVTESSLHQAEEDGHGNVQQRPPQPVETPQALLSRNPTQLRLLDRETGTSKPISTLQVRKLRDEVAHALISQSRSGKRVKRLRQVVQEHFVDGDENEGEGESTDHIAKPSFAIEGFASVLDLVRYEALQQHSKDDGANNRDNTPQPHHQLSTGCQALDTMLALPPEYSTVSTQMSMHNDSSMPTTIPPTGIPCGYVTQLSGGPASGKTQLALQIAAHQAATASTWYLCSSSSAGSYAKRLDQIVRKNSRGRGSSSPGTVLDRTLFRTVTDEYKVLSALADLEAVLLQHQEGSTTMDLTNEETSTSIPLPCQEKPTLLIIDSVSGCLSAENDDVMTKVALTLKRLARQNGLAVIITNGTVSDRSENSSSSSNPRSNTHKPALGRAWKSAADIHVWLEALSAAPISEAENIVVQARLDQHPAKRCFAKDDDPLVCTFCITPSGVQEVPTNHPY